MRKVRQALAVSFVTLAVAAVSAQIGGAPPQGGRGRAGGPPQPDLPTAPTAVALPSLSAEVTGPGPMFDSTPSLAPGKGMPAYGYAAHEFLMSGTANGQPYTTRLVIRRPTDMSKFSGLVLFEPMHGSGSAHIFEFTSMYTMASGHVAVEVLTTPPAQFVALNEARYKVLSLNGTQTNEILAQAGALVRSGILGAPVRKMVFGGTSMTAGVLINYLPAHMVYRTPQMARIFDGFMPMSNGAMVRDVDVPVVHVPTMHEVSGNITNKQDSDEPGKQYRLYEFSGMGHIDTRDSVRLKPNPCQLPLSRFPVQAYMSVALDHLFKWVDTGTVPPKADRILLDRDERNDGSMMALDAHGNPRGGIRTTYVDVPATKYTIRPAAASPVVPNASDYIRTGGQQAANLMCGLSTSQADLTPAVMKGLYKTPQAYAQAVEKRLTELEKAGWSLPVYREMILADARAVRF
jgi:hypothetical protein